MNLYKHELIFLFFQFFFYFFFVFKINNKNYVEFFFYIFNRIKLKELEVFDSTCFSRKLWQICYNKQKGKPKIYFKICLII